MLGMAACVDLVIAQLDVNKTFLHDDLDKEMYMEQQEGFMVVGNEKLVWKQKKNVYGLKQSPWQWYMKSESYDWAWLP